MLGAGLGLTLALQATTLRSGDFKDFYSVVVTVSRLAALVGTYLSVVGIFLVARIPIVENHLCRLPNDVTPIEDPLAPNVDLYLVNSGLNGVLA